MREILTTELTHADVPSEDADVGTLRRFAMTFNGYRRVGGIPVLSQVYDEVTAALEAGQPPDLNRVRAACFYLARAGDQTDQADEAIDAELRRLVAHIKHRLAPGT